MALLTRQHPGEGFDANLESAWISVSLVHKPRLMVKKITVRKEPNM